MNRVSRVVSRVASQFLSRNASDLLVRRVSQLGPRKLGFTSQWGDFTVEFLPLRKGDKVQATAILESSRLTFRNKVYINVEATLVNADLLAAGDSYWDTVWYIPYIHGYNETEGASFIRKEPTRATALFFKNLALSGIKDLVREFVAANS